MKFHAAALFALLVSLLSANTASAQKPPAIRTLGAALSVSTESLQSVTAAFAMPNGRVLVHDVRARRVLLFDSTLSKSTVIADTTGATANAYGTRPGALIPYRADSMVFIDQASLSMLVLSPTGQIARVMAIPRPDDAQFLTGLQGMPGFDVRGRMIYGLAGPGTGYLLWGFLHETKMPKPTDATRPPPFRDSAEVVRVDMSTRALDTLTTFKTSGVRNTLKGDAEGYITNIVSLSDPLPQADDWLVLRDGTVAVVRGRDYHVDWLRADGRWTSTPKMAFEWQHLDDVRKQAIIDSSYNAELPRMDAMNGRKNTAAASGAGNGGGSGGRGGRGSATGAATAERSGVRERVPSVAGKAALNDLPDYDPPFKVKGAAGRPLHEDADGNIWIRTSNVVKGEPVYDIVNRRGEVIDRVQLPPKRSIAGFGAGVVYLAVLDQGNVAHIERIKVK